MRRQACNWYLLLLFDLIKQAGFPQSALNKNPFTQFKRMLCFKPITLYFRCVVFSVIIAEPYFLLRIRIK